MGPRRNMQGFNNQHDYGSIIIPSGKIKDTKQSGYHRVFSPFCLWILSLPSVPLTHPILYEISVNHVCVHAYNTVNRIAVFHHYSQLCCRPLRSHSHQSSVSTRDVFVVRMHLYRWYSSYSAKRLSISLSSVTEVSGVASPCTLSSLVVLEEKDMRGAGLVLFVKSLHSRCSCDPIRAMTSSSSDI